MVTISRLVEKYVEEHPFIQEALSRGIINYAALSEEMHPGIEKEMKHPVKPSAVMMALRRLSENLEKTFVKKASFKDADIFVKSDLFEITLRLSEQTFQHLKRAYELVDPERDLMIVTQGISQVTVIANRRNKKKILELFDEEKSQRIIDGLSSLSTHLPHNATDEAGYLYLVTRAFAWENISIVEIVSTLTELNLIVREDDIPRSFKVLKEVLEKNR